MDANSVALALIVPIGISASFFVSASAGLGGSLVLVPLLTLVLGAKEGVAVAALLLGANNLVKLCAYRQVLPLVSTASLLGCTIVGSFVGAQLLVAAPEWLVSTAVIVCVGAAFLVERHGVSRGGATMACSFAAAAGAMSGFSGTSGPLKGIAVRSLRMDRLRTIGGAALLSAAGDLTKVAVFAGTGLLQGENLRIAIGAFPLMIVATLTGRRFAQVIGERGFARLFWLVMGGYLIRVAVGG